MNTIYTGDCLEVLKEMPSEAVNCIITSPPYWGLRAYKTNPVIWGGQKDCRHEWGKQLLKRKNRWSETNFEKSKQSTSKGTALELEQGQFCQACGAWCGELGLEPTPELYIEHLMMVFDECKRVLRKDGICFVNIGDTYISGKGRYSTAEHTISGKLRGEPVGQHQDLQRFGYSDKDMACVPEMFCLAMKRLGWIKRCTIIWAKGLSFCPTYSGSCMPDSCKDRPNKNGFEYVYMFTKSKKYWYEQQYEEAQELNAERPRMGQGNQTIYQQKRKDCKVGGFREVPPGQSPHSGKEKTRSEFCNPLGRTIRNVWTINPQAFSEAHFATFPEKLVEICLKMGCPEFVCKKCRKARSKIYNFSGGTTGESWHDHDNDIGQGITQKRKGIALATYKSQKEKEKPYSRAEIGLTDCGCNAGWRPGVSLDPFIGSGTVAVVAYQNRRDYIGIELSESYVKMARKRIASAQDQFSLLEKICVRK